MNIKIPIIFCIFVTLGICQELEMVIQMVRHGARTPKEFVFSNEFWQGYNPGDLTPSGIRMMYLLGQEMRQRYIVKEKILQEKYNKSELKIKTNTDQRTLNSVLSMLRGMFPDNLGQKVPKDLIDKSVPPIRCELCDQSKEILGENSLIHGESVFDVELVPRNYDLFFHGSSKKNCPVLEDVQDQNRKSRSNKEFIEYIDKNFKNKFINIINRFSEEKIDKNLKFTDYEKIYDSYITNRWYHKISNIFDDSDEELLKSIVRFSVLDLKLNEKIQQEIANTYFYRELLNYLEKKFVLGSTNSPKFLLYLVHDHNLIEVLSTLLNQKQLLDDSFLFNEFGSTLVFEIRKDIRGQRYVRIFFNDKELLATECAKQNQVCTLNSLMKLLQEYIIDDIETYCNLPKLYHLTKK